MKTLITVISLCCLLGCEARVNLQSQPPQPQKGHIAGTVSSIDWYNRSFNIVTNDGHISVMCACNKTVPVWLNGKFDIYYTYDSNQWDPCEAFDSVRVVK